MKFYINLSLLLIPFLMLSCMKDNATDLALQEEQLLVEYLQINNITAAPTPSGLYYIESVHGIGNVPQAGDSVLVHYTGYTIYGEKFDSSYDRNETFGFRLGTGWVIEGWDEGMGYMHEGTEATLIVPSSLAYGASGVPGIPPYTTLILEVKLISIIDELALQEEQILKEYLQTNNISVAPTPSGLYYIESVYGTGDVPQTGDSVLVHYTAYTIYGDKFDSSYDRDEPFGFRLGIGYVIAGWDEGIGYMHEGAEATFIIPSSLAYGTLGVPGIPPYSTLLFEVKLISIID